MKATFLYRGNSLCGYALEGHCGGVAGSDIVCAAVSSAAYLTANTITEIIKADANVSVDGIRCADILQGFHLHMTQLADDYPKQIQLTNSEV